MEDIRNVICDIISVMVPDEEEVKKFQQRSDDVKLADALLDLVVSNLIFKVLFWANYYFLFFSTLFLINIIPPISTTATIAPIA